MQCNWENNDLQCLNHKWIERSLRKKKKPNSLLAKTENPQYSLPYRMALSCLNNGVTPGWNGKHTASYVPLTQLRLATDLPAVGTTGR